MSPPLLECQGIHKQLGGRAVLADLCLAVTSGQVAGLVGPNGAGKTTLIRILAGLLRADQGRVYLNGTELQPRWTLERRTQMGVGYLAQGPTVFRALTVQENLSSVPDTTQERCLLMAERIGLQDHLSTAGANLSGGERRRLEVGRLLLTQPRILLCDEPFAALDPRGVQALTALLRDAVEQEGSVEGVLLTDHRVETVFSVCDSVSLLLDGGITMSGTPEALRADGLVRERYLGTSTNE